MNRVEPTYHPSTSNATISGTFAIATSAGKEKDLETGLSYFGAWYYDADLTTGWLSVDPMADKYPSISPYAYCAWTRPTGGDEHRWIKYNIVNNPVKLVDPDGRDIWKPNSDGNLIAEKGDNAATLATFLGISEADAQAMLSAQGMSGTDEIAEDRILTLDNVYTRSIQAAENGGIACLTKEQIAEQTMGMSKSQLKQWKEKWFSDIKDKYNCWGTVISGSQGDEIVGGCGIGPQKEYCNRLRKDYFQVNADDAVFGKTIVSFTKDGKVTHGAVYYGTSSDGTVYIYTKNGWFAPPVVMRLYSLPSSYGSVAGYHNPVD